MRNSSRSAILMCPHHSNILGEQNQPRNRNPLVQCCFYRGSGQHPSQDIMVELDHHRQYSDDERYAQMMRRNIRIPSNYYISTDPRTLPAQVIKSVAGSSGIRARKLVMRSTSSVTVRRAQYVKLQTATVRRSSSFSQDRVKDNQHLVKYRLSEVQTNNLPWEYRKAGIGVCLKGIQNFHSTLVTVLCSHCLGNKFDLLPRPVHEQVMGVRPCHP